MRNAAERQQLIRDRKRPLTNEDGSPRKHRLWVRNSWRACDVLEVPVDALVLNADNRRFRAERLWAEEQLGRSLDPENYPGSTCHWTTISRHQAKLVHGSGCPNCGSKGTIDGPDWNN